MGTIKDLITTFVGDKLTDILKSGTNKIADEISHVANNKILEYLCTEYERNNYTKTILHRTEPVSIDTFYQPLFLRTDSMRWNINHVLDKTTRINTENIKTLFSDNNCITIIGTAGSGKSTLVKYLFVNTIKTEYKIPLKIELRYLNKYSGNLIHYVKEEVVKLSGIANSDAIIEKLLDSGRFVVFFDGYDEISSGKKEEITKDICTITKKYRDNKYILTSRPFVNVEMLEKFRNYHVCDLSLDEIQSFVRKQFNETEQELATKIIETINNEDVKIYSSFLSNPLLLSMFIITYQTDTNVPQKKSEYYRQVFDTLYSAHDTTSKLGFSRERKCGLLKEQIVDVLKRFSFKSYFNNSFTFSLGYLENQLQNIKKDIGLSFSNEDFVYDMEVSIGILTQEGLDITYPHRSLQEYFAALFVTTLSYDNKAKIYDHLFNKLWSFFEEQFIHDDNVNFFSLLKEMDNEMFQKKLSIPIIEKISSKVPYLKDTTEIINYFVAIKTISFFFDTKMNSAFNKENDNYNKIFNEYVEKTNKNRTKINKKYNLFKMAQDELAQKHILPFLKSYDFDSIIKGIEKEMKKSEKIDSSFIDELF